MTLDEVRSLLLKKAEKSQVYRNTTGVRRWCEENGVQHPHVTEFLQGRRNPPNDMLDALGLEWRVMRKARSPRKIEVTR